MESFVLGSSGENAKIVLGKAVPFPSGMEIAILARSILWYTNRQLGRGCGLESAKEHAEIAQFRPISIYDNCPILYQNEQHFLMARTGNSTD